VIRPATTNYYTSAFFKIFTSLKKIIASFKNLERTKKETGGYKKIEERTRNEIRLSAWCFLRESIVAAQAIDVFA